MNNSIGPVPIACIGDAPSASSVEVGAQQQPHPAQQVTILSPDPNFEEATSVAGGWPPLTLKRPVEHFEGAHAK